MTITLDRRALLRAGALASGALLAPRLFTDSLRRAVAAPAQPGRGPYGPLGAQNASGLRLPAGFDSRVIAQAGQQISGTGYVFPPFPDGAATFPTDDGGFILVCNSEVPEEAGPGQGGASAIRFDRGGQVKAAYRILSGTTNNCAGGRTPWGTWMSGEEYDGGRIWECDPLGVKPAVAHDAMGVFTHEAVCVDPDAKRLYLSEDKAGGLFYRFTPAAYPDCSKGLLEAAARAADGVVSWHAIPDPLAKAKPTREQVKAATPFQRGEGIWFDDGIVYLATTSDERIWAYNTGTETMEVLYDAKAVKDPPLRKVDNVTVSPSGDVFVCEDPGLIGIGVITPEGQVARFLEVTGTGQRVPPGLPEDVDNETTGVVFDPSGTRLYFSAQRGYGTGTLFEVTGPFRLERVPSAELPPLRLGELVAPSVAAFRRAGLPVAVRLGRKATIVASLQATLPTRAGRRRKVTLARVRVAERRFGPVELSLRPSRNIAAQLRGRRRLTATLNVAITDADGQRRHVARTVTLS